MNQTISTKELAAILGISVTRVNELGRKHKITREADGKWSLVKVHAELKAKLDSTQASPALGQVRGNGSGYVPASDDGKTFFEAQRQHEWLKVQKEELALRIRRLELLEREEVKAEWAKGLNAFRNQLLLVPDKLAPKLAACSDTLECRALIYAEMCKVLDIFSEPTADAA